MDQRAIEGAMDNASEKSKEQWMVEAKNHRAIEGVIGGIQAIGQRADDNTISHFFP